MKIFRNRTILAVICILLTAAIAFIAIPSMNKSKEATVNVIRAAAEIPAGKIIEAQDIESVQIGAFNLQSGVITDSALVIGQYAILTMLPGDLITEEKLSGQKYQSLLERAINEKKNLATVTIASIAAGVGGHLLPGDIVSVYVYTSAYDDGILKEKVEAPLLISSLVLYDLENSRGKSVGGSLLSSTDEDIPRSATFFVDPKQAQALILAEYSGSIHLVFNSRGEEAS